MKKTYKQKLFQALTLITKELRSLLSKCKIIMINLLYNIKYKLFLLLVNIIFKPILYFLTSILITIIFRFSFLPLILYCSEGLAENGLVIGAKVCLNSKSNSIPEMPVSTFKFPGSLPENGLVIGAKVGLNSKSTITQETIVPTPPSAVVQSGEQSDNTVSHINSPQIEFIDTLIANSETNFLTMQTLAVYLIETFEGLNYYSNVTGTSMLLENIIFIIEGLPNDFFAINRNELADENSLMSELIKEIHTHINVQDTNDVVRKVNLEASLRTANTIQLLELPFKNPEIVNDLYNYYFMDRLNEFIKDNLHDFDDYSSL